MERKYSLTDALNFVSRNYTPRQIAYILIAGHKILLVNSLGFSDTSAEEDVEALRHQLVEAKEKGDRRKISLLKKKLDLFRVMYQVA